MKKPLFRFLIFCLLLLNAAPVRAAEGVPFSARVVRTSPGQQQPAESGRMYVSAQGVRTEGTVDGQPVHVIYQTAQNKVLILFPQTRHFLAQSGGDLGRPPLPDEPQSPCNTQSGFRCRQVGQASVQGRLTHHWEVITPVEGAAPDTTHLWVDPRLKLAILERYQDGSSVALTDIREGRQDPRLFRLPEGYAPLPSEPGRPNGPATRP